MAQDPLLRSDPSPSTPIASAAGHTVTLAGVAELQLPAAWQWLAPDAGRRHLRMISHSLAEILGVAVRRDDANAFAVFEFTGGGRIDDRLPFDAGDLLSRLQATAHAEMAWRDWTGDVGGTPIVGWAEAPHYEQNTHRLVWARRLAIGSGYFAGPMWLQNAPAVHACGCLLGRTGTIVITVLGADTQVASIRECLDELMRATAFLPGHRYDDFDPARDVVDSRGLAFLVADRRAYALEPESWPRMNLLPLVAVLLAVGLVTLLLAVLIVRAVAKSDAKRRRLRSS